VVRVEYDRLGRKIEMFDPDLGQISYTVDPLGRVLSQTSPKQRIRFQATGSLAEKTHSEYDDLDRLTARLEPDLKSYWVFDTATYGKGKLTEAYTLTGTVKDYRRVHTYDAIGRPGKTTQTLTDGTYTSTQAYDAWGRVISQTYQRNTDPAKQFDSRYHNGYLARIERGSLVLWKVNAQDAGNRPTSVALGNGLTQSRDFNRYMAQMTSGALSTAGNVARLQEGYDYDPLSNVVRRQQFWDQGGFQESFSYDALNRLATSTVEGRAKQTFQYDAAGNLLSKTGVGTGNYTYPAQGATAVRPHAVQSIPGIGSFVYDDNGNLISGNGRTMSWTSFDMPLTITGKDGSATFVYGPEHQRIRQTRGDGSSVVYAGAQEVEKNASGTTVKTYWPGGVGVEIDRPGATVSELYWHHLDRLGSVIGLTDQQGVLKEKLGYDAWGKRRTIDGASTPDNLDGQVDNRGFTGHEMLDQLDLVHMNGRVYDPLVARFISGDPLVEDPNNGQSFNRYSYVLNNPTNLTDPSGFSSEGPACGQNNDCAEIPKVEVKASREVVATEVSYGSSGGMQQVFVKGLRGNVPKSQAVDPKRNFGSANTAPNGGLLTQLKDGYTGDNRSVMWSETTAEKIGRYTSNMIDFGVAMLPGSSFPDVGAQLGEGNYVTAGVSMASELLGPLGKGGRVANATQKSISVGGGAVLEKLTAGELARIQNAANKSGVEITIVGSRVDPNKVLHAGSDYDYVIRANNKIRSDLKGSLPGAKNMREGMRINLDIFNMPVNTNLPYVTFYPK